MAVIIEELEATVLPPVPTATAPVAEVAPVPDARQLIELIAVETWARQRLAAD